MRQTITIRAAEASDVDALFHVRCSVRENLQTREELAGIGITPESVAAMADGRPRLPVLFVHGELDPLVPVGIARYAAAALPNATLRVVPGDLHDVLNEHDRDRVHDEVVAFVDEHALATAGLA